MSNANPLLAKLGLDNSQAHTDYAANWSYQDVEKKVWIIPKMNQFSGIGYRMEKRLNGLGIYSIKELTWCPKEELGQAGLRLWFHANDE